MITKKNMQKRYRIQFPRTGSNKLGQDETFFYLQEFGKDRKILLHDYCEIYKLPGLYEQIFYDRLHCVSPSKVASILDSAVSQSADNISELRVLDFGAGNGMMGETLQNHGVSRLVGVDIIEEAYKATIRDRPGLYDEYFIEDFTKLTHKKRENIASWNFDCMVTVAALGFGDIPTRAFIEAFNIIKGKGWVAFNIKETFLDKSDDTGFSRLIRELIFSEYLDIYHIERYRHRLSMEGEPLYYFAIVGRKISDVSSSFLNNMAL